MRQAEVAQEIERLVDRALKDVELDVADTAFSPGVQSGSWPPHGTRRRPGAL